ncbi:MAG: YwmB family TATA-box binding protein [Bacillota bacterium]|nr:YwmB family TATA-box binding protein [Bacillota bacterium]
MKRFFRITIIFMFFIVIMYSNSYSSKANDNISRCTTSNLKNKCCDESVYESDLFNDMINCSEGNVVEYGLKTSFDTKNDGEEISKFILNELNEKFDIQELKSSSLYSVEFKNDDINGYIESTREGNYNKVTINIIKKDTNNDLTQLRSSMNTILGKKQIHSKYFEYIKAKVNNNDLSDVNNKVINLLKIKKMKNIQTVMINNGFSTTLYTQKLQNKIYAGGLCDLNFALCKYTSGNYIIIGTPIITETY